MYFSLDTHEFLCTIWYVNIKVKKADGEVRITDIDKTEENKSLVKSYVKKVLIGRNLDLFPDYFNKNRCIQHNMFMEDGVSGWIDGIQKPAYGRKISYKKLHRMVARR